MSHLLIKELAKKQGLLQYEVQKRSGVTPQLLSRYWNNQTQRVELRSLAMIAKALGVKSGDLIMDDEEEVKSS